MYKKILVVATLYFVTLFVPYHFVNGAKLPPDAAKKKYYQILEVAEKANNNEIKRYK